MTGTSSWSATIPAPGIASPGHAVLLPRAFDEEPERVALADDLAHRANRLAVGLAAAHRARAEGADQLAEAEVAVDLALREEVDRPRAARAEGRRIEPREVVHREHDAAFERECAPTP